MYNNGASRFIEFNLMIILWKELQLVIMELGVLTEYPTGFTR
jgi:hypothetical protein